MDLKNLQNVVNKYSQMSGKTGTRLYIPWHKVAQDLGYGISAEECKRQFKKVRDGDLKKKERKFFKTIEVHFRNGKLHTF